MNFGISEIVAQHVAILGKTRSGKSSVARLLVESMLKAEQPVCIVDPKGDWWGIKLGRDGRSAGFPVVIFGGEHADVPINEHAGAHVAELFATGNRPCLVDLGGWMPGERTRFWIDFASSLFRHTRGERWLVVDEVHNFAPKGKIMDPNSGKALHWANRLASEGLGKGLHLIFASQRPQKVHNDTLTSAETLIAMRVLHPADRGAVSDWIKGCGDLELGNKVLAQLAQMERGEGWVWSPEAGIGPERVKFPMFATYDSFKAQPVGGQKLTGWAAVDLEQVKAKLAAVVKEAEANDPRTLKTEIARLKREAAGKSAPMDPKALAAAEQRGYQRGASGTRAAIHARVDTHLAQLVVTLREVQSSVQTARRALGAATPQQDPVPAAAPRRAVPAPAPRPRGNGTEEPAALGTGERRILGALAQHPEGCDSGQLSILVGYKRSSRNAYVQRLRSAGYVETAGNVARITEAGLAALGEFDPLPTGDALREYWLQRLPEGERRLLAVLVEAYPSAVPRDAIDEGAGYRRSSRNAYLQRLLARKLISGGREVRAADLLFD